MLATGGGDFVQEVRADLGEDLACVEVKKTLGPSACLSLTPKKAQALIREASKRAVAGRASRKPLVADPPVVIEVHFHAVAMQERAMELGGEPIDTRGIRYTGPDTPATVKEVWRGLAHSLREEAAFLK